MGQGLGETQKAILGTLTASDDSWLSTDELATRLRRSPRQIRVAVRALERRGLVVLTKGNIGWRGWGKYGPLSLCYTDDPRPVALTVHEGEQWPGSKNLTAIRDVEFARCGMPTFGLKVWLPETRKRFDERAAASAARWRAALGLTDPQDQ